jgi:hypothetical protein
MLPLNDAFELCPEVVVKWHWRGIGVALWAYTSKLAKAKLQSSRKP